MKMHPANEAALQHEANALVAIVSKSTEAAARIVELSVLLDGSDRMYIVHGGKKYCLRITAQNKLILTA